jgi:hypothetical protein
MENLFSASSLKTQQSFIKEIITALLANRHISMGIRSSSVCLQRDTTTGVARITDKKLTVSFA